MKLLFYKGLHKLAYIGDICDKGTKFKAKYVIARDFDTYHIRKINKSFDIDISTIYDFPIPKEVLDEICYFDKSITDIIKMMDELTKVIELQSNTPSLRRKADYYIIKSYNDYVGRIDYYYLVDNVLNKSVLFMKGEYSNWNIYVGVEKSTNSGMIYELSEEQYIELIKNCSISRLYNYPKLSNFMMDMVQYVTHEKYPDCDRPRIK